MSITAPPLTGHPVTSALAAARSAVDATTDPGAEVWRLADRDLLTATGEYLDTLATCRHWGPG